MRHYRNGKLFNRLLLITLAGPAILLVGTVLHVMKDEPKHPVNFSTGDLFIGMALGLWLLYTIREMRRTSSGIRSVEDRLHILATGSYPEKQDRTDAIGMETVSADLDVIVDQLKTKSNFALQISGGDLSTNLDILGEADILGKSLQAIKENLIHLKAEEQKRAWTTQALGSFVELLRSTKDIKSIANDIIINMVKTLHANQGAIFIAVRDEQNVEYLDMQACYAYNKTKYLSKRVDIGEGLLGQIYLEKETLYLKEIPPDFVRITSGLGDANPTHLLIIPLRMDKAVTGIIEIASFQEFAPHEIEFAEKIGESIAHAITSFRTAETTKTLLQQADERAEEMHAQEEELRQNQEELQATQEEISRKYAALFSRLKELNHQAKFDQLLSITFAKKRNIEYYFDIIRNQIITFAEDKMIIDAMKAFASAFEKIESSATGEKLAPIKSNLTGYYEKEFIPRLNDNTDQAHDAKDYVPTGKKASVLQYLYLSNNTYPTGKKSLLNDPMDGSEYSKVHAEYHPVIRRYLELFGYYDIFLLDCHTGELVYSVFKEVDFATSLLSGPYGKTNFGKVVYEAITSTDREFVRLIDFEMYAPSYGAQASFIARPIYDNGVKVGILVFQMPINKVNQILTGNNHWREDGLGNSGETFMVGDDHKLRSITRGMSENPTQHLTTLKKRGYPDDIVRLIGKTETNILLETVKLDSVHKALNGNSGQHMERDSDGIECLYTYAPLFIPDVHWAIISSLQEEEASARIESLRNN